MSVTPIEGQLLWENTEARQLHEAGLKAQTHGDLEETRQALGEAIQIVASEPEPSGDGLIQLARITRDEGFTYVREAIAESNEGNLNDARRVLLMALSITRPMVEGDSDAFFMSTKQHFSESNEAAKQQLNREVYAEHGATLGLLGRLATARAVLLDIDTRGEKVDARRERTIEQRYYDQAHRFLRQGGNGYYRVSNALAGARREVINGQRSRVLLWLARTATGLAWTMEYDYPNFQAAFGTVARRLPYALGSYEAAKASVLAKP